MACAASWPPTRSCWRPVRIERARPLLGTIVSVRAEFDDGRDGEAAVQAAFDEIAELHSLMSVHSPDSDLARIARHASEHPVTVDFRTMAVLTFSVRMAEASGGAFDPVAAASAAVAAGVLPRPDGAPQADPAASWRDLEFDDDRVRLKRPGWVDLGGVAKGYAVDRAVESLGRAGARQATVNAGGDLRAHGPETQTVRLRAPGPEEALIELQDAAVASSGWTVAGMDTIHLDPLTRRLAPAHRFVAVTAGDCMTADALTKVVLARGDASEALLRERHAQAHVFDGAAGWRHLGEGG